DSLGLRDPELRGELGGQLLDRYAHPTANHLARLGQLIHDRTRHVARDRKTDPIVATALTEYRGIDSNQLPTDIHESPPGVAGIDRCVRLDEILILRNAHAGPSHGADDSHRDRLIEPEWIPDGQHELPHFELVGVRSGDRWKPLCLNFKERKIRLRVGPNQFSFE